MLETQIVKITLSCFFANMGYDSRSQVLFIADLQVGHIIMWICLWKKAIIWNARFICSRQYIVLYLVK